MARKKVEKDNSVASPTTTLTTRDSSLETEVSQEVPEYLERHEDLSETHLPSEPAV